MHRIKNCTKTVVPVVLSTLVTLSAPMWPVSLAQETTAPKASTELATQLPAAEKAEISFSFKEKPWEDVLEWLAELTGRSLLPDKMPTGNFNYVDSKKYTLDEAVDIINGVLLNKGFVLLTRDNFLVVTEVEDIPPHLVPRVEIEDLPKRGATEFVKVLVTLQGLIAEDAKKEFDQMMIPHGKIMALKSTNQLILVGTARSVQQVISLIKETETGEGSGELKLFQLKHVRALEVEVVVRDMLGLTPRGTPAPATGTSNNRGGATDPRAAFMQMMAQRGGRDRFSGAEGAPPGGIPGGMPGGMPGAPPGAQPGQVPGAPAAAVAKGPSVSVDERTNTLFVTATPDKLQMVTEIIKAIDVPQMGDGDTVPQTPRIEVYPVEAGTAEGLVRVMETIFQRSPETRVSAVPDGRALFVYATPLEHEKIRAVIDQLKTEGLRIEVIPLNTLDAALIASLIKSLYGQKEDDSSSRLPFFFRSQSSNNDDKDQAFSIEADTDRNRLLVRGSEERIEEIRGVLAKLGETGLGFGSRGMDRGNFRVLRVGENDPEELARNIQKVWSSIRPNNTLKVQVLGQSNSAETPQMPVDRPEASENRRGPGEGEGRPPMRRRPPADRSDRPAPNDGNELPEPKASDESASVDGSSVFRLVSAEQVSQPAGENPVAAEPEKAPVNEPGKLLVNPPGDVDPAAPPADAVQPGNEDEVTIVVGPDNIAISSTNPELLDILENLIKSMIGPIGQQTAGFAIYYLKAADAQEMSYIIDEALYGTRSPFALEDNTQQARILPDSRTNAILVVGSPAEQRKVKALLEVLDQEDTPESGVLTQPRMIQLQNADATEVSKVIKDVFAAYLPANGPQNQQQPGQNPFMSMFGGSSARRKPTETAGKLSIGVETQTNTLVVSASKVLFEQVEELALSLDDYASANPIETRVVELKGANPAAVQKALKNLFGVKTGEDKSKAANTQNNGNASPTGDPNMNGFGDRFRNRGGDTGGDRGGNRGGGDRGGSRGRGGFGR